MYLSALSSAVRVVALQPGQSATGVNIQAVLSCRFPNLDVSIDVAAELSKNMSDRTHQVDATTSRAGDVARNGNIKIHKFVDSVGTTMIWACMHAVA